MMGDSEIIALLFARSEEAIRRLSEKYGKLCMRIAMNILGNREDAEECVNDAYLGIWEAIPPTNPASLEAYLCRLVRNISLNRRKFNQAGKRASGFDLCLEELENCLAASGEIDEQIQEKALRDCLEEFLENLDPENRWIFVRRFWYADSYRDIAKESGLGEAALRLRMLRIKRRLRRFLEEKGVFA